jgi:hypothetical protein
MESSAAIRSNGAFWRVRIEPDGIGGDSVVLPLIVREAGKHTTPTLHVRCDPGSQVPLHVVLEESRDGVDWVAVDCPTYLDLA